MAGGLDVNQSMLEAQDATNALNLNLRKTMAFNALSRVYGPAAGDPDAALKMQEYGQREQTNPIAVQQQQATLTGMQQTNAFNAEDQPLKVQAQQLENAGAAEKNSEQPLAFASEQAQRTAQTGLVGAETAHTNVETATSRQALNEQQSAVAGRVVNSLMSLRDSGGDINAAYSALSPALVKMGVMDPSRAAAVGQAIQTDPKYLDNLAQSLGYGVGAKGMTQIPASDDPRVMVSVPTSSMPKAQPGVQYTINRQTGMVEGHTVGGTPQDQKFQTGQRTVNQEIEKARMQFNTNEIRFGTTQKNIDQAIANADGAGLVGGMTSFIPGSKAANLKAALSSVHADIVNNVIQGYKDSTPKGQASGVGRVMQAEIQLWQDAFAATQQTSSPTILRTNLGRLKQVTDQLQQANRLYNKSVYGFDPTPTAGNGGQLPGGFTYLGPTK